MRPLDTILAALATAGLLACGTSTEAVRYDQTATTKGPATEVEIDAAVSEACGMPTNKAFFDYGSAELDPADRIVLRAIGDCMNDGALEGDAVLVVGFADSSGTEPYNEALGLSRSERVAEYLVTHCDVPPQRIFVRSEGERKSGDLDDAAYDRRVEIRAIERG